MPRRRARARKPATQRAKAGDWAANERVPSAKPAVAPNALASHARRLSKLAGAAFPKREIRGMRHCSHDCRANNRCNQGPQWRLAPEHVSLVLLMPVPVPVADAVALVRLGALGGGFHDFGRR